MMARNTRSDCFKCSTAFRIKVDWSASRFTNYEMKNTQAAMQTNTHVLPLGKILQCCVDKTRCPLVRIARPVPLHRAVAFISMLFHESECLGHVHMSQLAMLIGLGVFYVRYAVSMREHSVDAIVSVLLVVSCQRIGEIRQRVQPRAIYFFYDFHQEERFFTDRIVILQIDHNVLRGCILRHASKAVSGALQIGF